MGLGRCLCARGGPRFDFWYQLHVRAPCPRDDHLGMQNPASTRPPPRVHGGFACHTPLSCLNVCWVGILPPALALLFTCPARCLKLASRLVMGKYSTTQSTTHQSPPPSAPPSSAMASLSAVRYAGIQSGYDFVDDAIASTCCLLGHSAHLALTGTSGRAAGISSPPSSVDHDRCLELLCLLPSHEA